jgi:hypothetical protein
MFAVSTALPAVSTALSPPKPNWIWTSFSSLNPLQELIDASEVVDDRVPVRVAIELGGNTACDRRCCGCCSCPGAVELGRCHRIFRRRFGVLAGEPDGEWSGV